MPLFPPFVALFRSLIANPSACEHLENFWKAAQSLFEAGRYCRVRFSAVLRSFAGLASGSVVLWTSSRQTFLAMD